MKMTSFSINGRTVKSLFINGKPVKLEAEPVEYAGLCFTAEEADSSVQLTKVGSAPDVLLLTSTNGRTWHHYEVGDVINLTNAGDKVYIKAMGSNDRFGSSYYNYHKFVMTGSIAASGNINSLLNEDFENIDTVTDYCYYNLFRECSSLIAAPELPATTLANYCYYYMFYKCESLTQAPALPADTLKQYCYAEMFNGCTSLIQAPALPAMALAASCYLRMFAHCTSLTEAPELPATTLANTCYLAMFSYCEALTLAPALPATTLISYCYSEMFLHCISLIQAPDLPATTLSIYCYPRMFEGCTSLNKIKVSFKTWNSTGTTNWLPSNTGTFECTQELITNTSTRTASTVPTSWTMVAYDSEPECLCFTAEEAGSTVKLSKVGAAPAVNLQTSTDGISWTPYVVEEAITLANVEDKVYFKAVGSNLRMGSSGSVYNKFVMTGRIAASGNVNSLLEEDEETARTMSLAEKTYCYSKLFDGCTSLTKAPALPATTLVSYCYYYIFSGCSSLTQAPALPATTMASYCYSYMFYNCTSLTQAPALPAMALASSCYLRMFTGCTSLTQAPELPATTLATTCYLAMFSRCSSLIQAPALPATTLISYCYSEMFLNCTALTQAPDLPATTLSNYCYPGMFEGCTSLNKIKVSFKTWNSTGTNRWLPENSGTFECPWDLITNTTTRSTSTVPASWTMVAV